MPNDTSGSYTGPYPVVAATPYLTTATRELDRPGFGSDEEAAAGYFEPGNFADETSYAKGALVKDFVSGEGDWVYESLADENEGNDPSEDGGVHWKPLRLATPSVEATPLPAGGDQPIVEAPGSGESPGTPEV